MKLVIIYGTSSHIPLLCLIFFFHYYPILLQTSQVLIFFPECKSLIILALISQIFIQYSLSTNNVAGPKHWSKYVFLFPFFHAQKLQSVSCSILLGFCCCYFDKVIYTKILLGANCVMCYLSSYIQY